MDEEVSCDIVRISECGDRASEFPWDTTTRPTDESSGSVRRAKKGESQIFEDRHSSDNDRREERDNYKTIMISLSENRDKRGEDNQSSKKEISMVFLCRSPEKKWI